MSPSILRRVWTIRGCAECPFYAIDPEKGLAEVCRHPGKFVNQRIEYRPHPVWCPLVEAPTLIVLKVTS